MLNRIHDNPYKYGELHPRKLTFLRDTIQYIHFNKRKMGIHKINTQMMNFQSIQYSFNHILNIFYHLNL
jgi:hypothetical protein